MHVKKNALILTFLLLISGISLNILWISTQSTNNSLEINPNVLASSTTTYDWINIWQEGLTQFDQHDDVAVNSTGSIIMGGNTQAEHQYLAVYDKDTGTRVWNDTINIGYADSNFQALDVNGTDIYVTSTNGSYMALNYKYNETKSQEWNNTWDHVTALQTQPNDIALGASYMYLVGQLSSGGFLAKFDTSGNEQWNVSVAGAYRCLGAVVNGSSIFVVGRSTGADPFLAKHSTTDGGQDWIVYFGTTNVDQADDVAVDNSGNIYVTGAIQNPGYQAFLAKFNSTGHQQWMVNYTTDSSAGQKLAIDISNNYIFVAGWVGDGYYDYPTHKALQLKYDSNGILKANNTWQLETNYWAHASSIAIDSSGNVYLVGRANNTEGLYKAFIIKNLGKDTTTTIPPPSPPPIPGFELIFIVMVVSLIAAGYSMKKKKT